MIAVHYIPISTNAPTPKELRLKFKIIEISVEIKLYKNNFAIFIMDLQTRVTAGRNLGMTWTKDALVQTVIPRSCVSMSNLQTRYEGNRFQL